MSLPLAERQRKKRARQDARSKRRFARAYGSHAYVAAVVSHPCVVAQRGKNPTPCVLLAGRPDAAHVEKKTRDSEWATWRGLVPLCQQHHNEGEGRDPDYYLTTYGVDIKAEAQLMVATYGHLVPKENA